jgi:hypothetical protein
MSMGRDCRPNHPPRNQIGLVFFFHFFHFFHFAAILGVLGGR